MRFADVNVLALAVILFAGCGSMMDDLIPSSQDKRIPLTEGGVGPGVGQRAADVTLYDTHGNVVSVANMLDSAEAAVLYFTMWCPVCDLHMNKMRGSIVSLYPHIRFFLVDYISGTVAGCQDAAQSNGYNGPHFTVLADTAQSLLHAFAATMGTTVIIDSAGIIRMNEDFKDGVRLRQTLENLN